jgi:hypothetical protein
VNRSRVSSFAACASSRASAGNLEWIERQTCARGRWIFVSPRRQLVVASTAENDDFRFSAAVGFPDSHVLPSVGE